MSSFNSEGTLTWHDGVIPGNEVWIKLGGDKGGGAFKMNFQIVNTSAPNSIYNTCVFACFEALANLHINASEAVRQFKVKYPQVKQ